MAKKKDPYSYEALVEQAKKHIKPDKDGNRIIPKDMDESFRKAAENISNLTNELKIEIENSRQQFDDYNKAVTEQKEWELNISTLEKEIKDLKRGKKPSVSDKSFGANNTFFTKADYEAAKKTVRSQLYPGVFQRLKKWLSK